MTEPVVARSVVERRVHESMFGKPVIGNTTRGLFVEAMLAVALEPHGWNWVAGNWSSWTSSMARRG